jgi:hypothetical protein
MMDFKGYAALQLTPASSLEKFLGIDPDYRCIGTALWRWWRILGSPSRYLVIEGVFKEHLVTALAFHHRSVGAAVCATFRPDGTHD